MLQAKQKLLTLCDSQETTKRSQTKQKTFPRKISAFSQRRWKVAHSSSFDRLYSIMKFVPSKLK